MLIASQSLASVLDGAGQDRGRRAFGIPLHSNPENYPYGIYTFRKSLLSVRPEEHLTDEDVPYEVGVAYYREIAPWPDCAAIPRGA